ncbi:hypothetical protein TNCV_519321 [Trichonephila clavipes]|nr:hypothetical protein TNCV_519321 [Trichonephila clavipes]
MRARPTVPNSVYLTLGPEAHEHMFRSSGQPDAPIYNKENKYMCYITESPEIKLRSRIQNSMRGCGGLVAMAMDSVPECHEFDSRCPGRSAV